MGILEDQRRQARRAPLFKPYKGYGTPGGTDPQFAQSNVPSRLPAGYRSPRQYAGKHDVYPAPAPSVFGGSPLMQLAQQAIAGARRSGEERRAHAVRITGMKGQADFERAGLQEEGETRRLRMQQAGLTERTEMTEAGATERAGMQPKKGGITSSQMANIKMKARESAIKQLGEEWETSGGIDRLTKKELTPERKKELIDTLTNSNLKFMLGEAGIEDVGEGDEATQLRELYKQLGLTKEGEEKPLKITQPLTPEKAMALRGLRDATGSWKEDPRTLFSLLQKSGKMREELEQALEKTQQKFYKDVGGTAKYIAKDPRAAIRRTSRALRIY